MKLSPECSGEIQNLSAQNLEGKAAVEARRVRTLNDDLGPVAVEVLITSVEEHGGYDTNTE